MPSMNFASSIVTITPNDGSGVLTVKSNQIWNQEDFLGDAQPEKERGKRFTGNDGKTYQTIHNYASGGKRELTLMDGIAADRLTGMAQANPTVHFNLSFQIQRNDNPGSDIINYVHEDCFVENTPARVLNNETIVIKFMINYGSLSVQNSSGQSVS